MARPAYNQDAKNQIFSRFIMAAYETMNEEGLQAVTIRGIAQKVGYKSATLYHYFPDLDHLVMHASMKYLRDYNQRLAEDISEITDPMERFCEIWKLFAQSAFRYPEAFYMLFFGKHRDDLEDVIRSYYQVFPEELPAVDATVDAMLQFGRIFKRNLAILEPLVEEGYLAREDLHIYNEIIVFSFQALLREKINQKDALNNDSLIRRHQTYIRTLLKK